MISLRTTIENLFTQLVAKIIFFEKEVIVDLKISLNLGSTSHYTGNSAVYF